MLLSFLASEDIYIESPSGSGACFSKVPKLYGPFSGVTIPFVSQARRGFKSSNFTVTFLFVTLKTCQKISFPNQAAGTFTNGFSGPKSFRDFRETGPRNVINISTMTVNSAFGYFDVLKLQWWRLFIYFIYYYYFIPFFCTYSVMSSHVFFKRCIIPLLLFHLLC